MTADPHKFRDKIVVITGGGSGLGYACAQSFAAQGAHLLLVGRSAEKLETACKALGPHSQFYVGDVTMSDTADTAMAQCQTRFGGGPDILVNNAGAMIRKTAEDTTDAEWAHVMAINATGVFYFSRAFAKQATKGGSIVNVSSTCGQVGAAGLAAYCASKGAVDQLTRTMALELAPRKITVNAVAPGAINSPMLFSQHADPKDADTVVEHNEDTIPIGRVAEPEEVARAVLFLASEPHITGTILSVDGGYTAQ